MDKFRLLYEVLLADGLIDDESYFLPTEPPLDWLYKVHLPDYVDRFLEGTLSAQEMRKIGFEHSVELVRRTLLEVGGTVLTCELALRHRLACNLAGGTHHAHRDHGSGFTILNDLAVASRVLLEIHNVHKILILDLDVHQGDGTATIFSDDARVFTASFHCQDNWPWRKAVSDLDVGLPAGMGDEAYMDKLQDILPNLIDTVKPDVMFYLSGVDPHVADALGKLNLTDEGLSRRDEYVISTAVRMGVPIACVIGGGYDPDTRVVSRRHALLHHAATGVWRELYVKPDVPSQALI